MRKQLVLVLIGLFALVLVVWGQGIATGNLAYLTSITRLKKVNVGLAMYCGDSDDVLPLGPGWMDVLLPYVRDEINFHSPAVQMPGYGYAYNADIVGRSVTSFEHPDTTVTVFDSTDLSRNAVEGLQTLPFPPRYVSNTIGYADGHVQDDFNLNDPPTLYQQSRLRLGNAELGMLMYATDTDDRAPLANRWMDELYPYTKTYTVFRSPAIERQDATKFGYAFNIDLAGIYLPDLPNPSTTISLFDSTVLAKNATAPTATLPFPPRYTTNNTIAFADGHVQ